MTTHPTHSTRLARLAAADGFFTYAEALDLIRRARDEHRLPEILDDDGMRDALLVLDQLRNERKPTGSLGLHLGLSGDGKPFYLGASEMSSGTLLLGSTGSGRTVAMAKLIKEVLGNGWPALVLDLDGDTTRGGLRDFCKAQARKHNVEYHEVSTEPSATNRVDPLAGLSALAARDLLLSLLSIDDSYWHGLAKRLLTQITDLFYSAHVANPDKVAYPSIPALGAILESPSLSSATVPLRRAVRAMDAEADARRFSMLVTPNPDMQKVSWSVGARIVEGYCDAGAQVLSGTQSDFDLGSAGLCYIGVSLEGHADLAKLLSTAVLARECADMQERTQRGSARSRRFLFVTRASAVDSAHLSALLSKARAGGMSIVVSDQSLLSWGTHESAGVVNNTNVVVAMRQTGDTDAFATRRLVGGGEITVQTLRELAIGEAIVHVKLPAERTTLIKVATPSEQEVHHDTGEAPTYV
jgi:hypothetical protein